MKMFTPDGSELLEVSRLEWNGQALIVKGMIMGTVPMTAMIRPAEARHGLRLLNLGAFVFLFTVLFRWWKK
jgi:hypothetical protein